MSDGSLHGGEPRPRPQYGEYATPEQQRAHIRQPAPSQAPVPVEQAPPQAPPAGAPWMRGHAASSHAHPVDRIVTIALLAYGALNVVFALPAYFNLPAYMKQVMTILGIAGDFTNLDGARLWGPIAAAVLVAGFAVTAWIAVRHVRRGRLSWWIPVVGAVVSYVLVAMCLTVVILGDPAFVQFAGTPRP